MRLEIIIVSTYGKSKYGPTPGSFIDKNNTIMNISFHNINTVYCHLVQNYIYIYHSLMSGYIGVRQDTDLYIPCKVSAMNMKRYI